MEDLYFNEKLSNALTAHTWSVRLRTLMPADYNGDPSVVRCGIRRPPDDGLSGNPLNKLSQSSHEPHIGIAKGNWGRCLDNIPS